MAETNQKVFFRVDEESQEVVYYMKHNGTEYPVHHNYYIYDQRCIANRLYEKVSNQAKKNGTIHVTWVQRHFNLPYNAAYMIIDRMYDNGLCTEHDHEFGARRMIDTPVNK